MAEAAQTSSGVQELIARIRDEGVQSGQQQADEIVRDARKQAAQLVAAAKSEVEEMRRSAKDDIESQHTAAIEALKLAARDSGLELKSRVVNTFKQAVGRIVSDATRDDTFVRSLVLVLAGRAVDEVIQNKDIQIEVSAFADEQELTETQEKARKAILSISGDMLRDGIELIPTTAIEGGARVQIVDDNLSIDLSDAAISRLLLRYLLPRFSAILEGRE